MNLDVYVLGTSGMMPLPERFLTSAIIRREGDLFLFDCGEATQISLKMLNIHWKKIHSIFISHMHADHITGLPGILMLSSQVDRAEPLYIYGPPQVAEYVDQNRRLLDMYINYDIVVKTAEPGTVMRVEDFRVDAFELTHTKPCLGYRLVEDERPGLFHPEIAESLGVPKGPLWGMLQSGKDVALPDGRVIRPCDVMGGKRAGRKISYVTDSQYRDDIASNVFRSDLFLCEGMFLHELKEDADRKKHMTSLEAGIIAKDAEVGKLGLIHFSPRYTNREIKMLEKEAREVFPEAVACKDRMSFEIPLKD